MKQATINQFLRTEASNTEINMPETSLRISTQLHNMAIIEQNDMSQSSHKSVYWYLQPLIKNKYVLKNT